MISVVIPNYNGRFLLEDCLESIDKNSYKPREIIVVDNGSTDDSLLFLKLNYQKVKVIKNKINLGFAKAVNQGIKAAKEDWVAVINNDIILDKDWFKNIKKAIGKYKGKCIGCYCGLILDKTGKKIEGRGLEYQIYGKAKNIDNGQKYQKKSEKESFVFGSSGAAVVYNKKAITKAGLFDKDFFAYLEDVDLSLRLQNNGFLTVYLPQVYCRHLGGETSAHLGNLREKKTFQNWFYIFIKHYSLKTIITNLPAIIFERGKVLSSFVKKTPIYRLPFELGLIFLQIMLKSPRMVGKRSPIDDKLLEQLSKKHGS
jgi:GT2 family glycosyltransferase